MTAADHLTRTLEREGERKARQFISPERQHLYGIVYAEHCLAERVVRLEAELEEARTRIVELEANQ